MAPDLASVIGGINDILRPKVDLDAVAGEIEAIVAALRGGGATVLMLTYPDPARIMAFAREPSPRVLAYNDALREIAARHEARLMDLGRYGVARPAPLAPRPPACQQRGARAHRAGRRRCARASGRERRVARPAAARAARVPLRPCQTRGRLGRPVLRALGGAARPRAGPPATGSFPSARRSSPSVSADGAGDVVGPGCDLGAVAGVEVLQPVLPRGAQRREVVGDPDAPVASTSAPTTSTAIVPAVTPSVTRA